MATKALTTLIKVHKQRSDTLRREMTALEEEQRQLQMLSARIRHEYGQEMQMVANDPAYAGFFGAYSTHIRQRIAGIDKEILRLAHAIEDKRAAIAEAFGEQKKYEIALDTLRKKLLAQEKAMQQQRFDEVGTQQYIRRQDTDA